MKKSDKSNEEEYIEYVNYSYCLSKYAPEMADLIVHAKGWRFRRSLVRNIQKAAAASWKPLRMDEN